MGSSFKLKSGGKAKEQARSAGALALILGVVAGFLFHPIGFVIAVVGLIALVGSAFASE